MSDEELIARLRSNIFGTGTTMLAADRIETLVKEKEQLGREVNMARYGQPDFAWSIHEDAMADLETKLAKAIEALQWCAMYGDGDVALATLAEIKGESQNGQ